MHLTSILPLMIAPMAAAASLLPLNSIRPSLLDIQIKEQTPSSFHPPTIQSITFSGNGCPQSGTTPLKSGGWAHLRVTLPDFAVSYGGSVNTRTANCQAHVNLADGVPGWQVGLRDLWSRGRVELEPGVTLKQYVTVFYSQDAGNTVSTVQTLESAPNATISRDIELHAEIPESSVVWSPCTGRDGAVGILNVNFRVALTSTRPDAYGYYGGGKNATVTERWGWTWRRC